MKAIVTGRFEAEQQAVQAIDKLLQSRIASHHHVRTFFLNPPEPRVRHAWLSSARKLDDAALGSTTDAGAVELEVGPAAVAGGVEVSAYRGSLADAFDGTGEKNRPGSSPPAQIMVAVETSDNVSQLAAISVLRKHGARDVERAQDPWQDGKCPGFDPIPLSSLIDVSRK